MGRFNPRTGGVLFVFEAPNLEDTVHPEKGYITYDTAPGVTDPTGSFTRELFTEILGIGPQDFQVTNAVLCLPARDRNQKFSVRAIQLKTCSDHLRRQIELLGPAVVASVGVTALKALNRIEPHGQRSLRSSVGKAVRWHGRWLFPLAHTSRLGRLNRPAHEQRSDWIALKQLLDSLSAGAGVCARSDRALGV